MIADEAAIGNPRVTAKTSNAWYLPSSGDRIDDAARTSFSYWCANRRLMHAWFWRSGRRTAGHATNAVVRE